MAMFQRKPAGKSGAGPVVYDYRTEPRLLAARQRRAEITDLLSTLEGGEVPAAQTAVAEADRLLEAAEIQSLSGRMPDSELARFQMDVLNAKRSRAIVMVRVDDLKKEATKLDTVTIPALDLAAKKLAQANLQASYMRALKDMAAALEFVPSLAQTLKDLRQLASDQFPSTHLSYDPTIDRRFDAACGLPLVALSQRVIRHGSGGQRWMDTEVTMPDAATIPLLEETKEAIRATQAAIDKVAANG